VSVPNLEDSGEREDAWALTNDQDKTVVKLRFKRVHEVEAGVETLETWSVEQVLRFFERRKFPTEASHEPVAIHPAILPLCDTNRVSGI
jgi:hypothetical protein